MTVQYGATGMSVVVIRRTGPSRTIGAVARKALDSRRGGGCGSGVVKTEMTGGFGVGVAGDR